MLGITARLTAAALQVTGSGIPGELGLGFVTATIRRKASRGWIVGNILTILSFAVLFATDLLELVIAALGRELNLFVPCEVPLTSHMAPLVTRTAAGACASTCSSRRCSWSSASCSMSACRD